MKRSLLLGAVSALAMIGSAGAADLGGMKEAAPTPPLWNWAGFYVGVNGGWIWNEGGISTLAEDYFTNYPDLGTNFDRRQTSLSGGFGGGQIGFNIQHDRLVYGLETDFQGASLSASNNAFPDQYPWNYGYSNARGEAQLDWFGSFRGRLGLVPWENILVYVTAGVAYGGVNDNLHHFYDWGNDSLNGSNSDVHVGYDLGAGVEWGVTPAWSVKLEYQFMDLGSVRLSESAIDYKGFYPCPVSVASQFEEKLSFNTVRLGINYHLVPEYVPLK